MKNNRSNKRPSHAVFVVEGEGESAFWTKIGSCWQHEDGEGFNIALTAVPLTGRLVIRKRQPKAEGEAGQ